MSSTLNVKLVSGGRPVPFGAYLRVAFNQDTDAQAYSQHFTDDAGTVAFEFTPPGPKRLYPHAPGFTAAPVDVVMPHDDQIVIDMQKVGETPAPTGPLARLERIDGHRMANARGEKVFGRMASAFLLFKKHLDGEDITPQLEQLQALGFNVLRVMGMFESLGGFNPKVYGVRYYDEIPVFMRRCAGFGFYVYWVACAATGTWMTEDEALAHTIATAAKLLETDNPIFSWVNEQGEHNNSVDRARFSTAVHAGWMLYDTGSFGSDKPCQAPFGTHACLHCNRAYPANVKDGCTADHPNMVNDQLEVWMDEPVRYGDEGSGDGHTDPQRAADAAGTAYTALGWCFHSMQGERGELLRGNTLDCARAAAGAMRGH